MKGGRRWSGDVFSKMVAGSADAVTVWDGVANPVALKHLRETDRWLHSEIIPGMDVKKGKLVVIGNLLHMDALLSRLKAHEASASPKSFSFRNG
jgi:hypothetical protein